MSEKSAAKEATPDARLLAEMHTARALARDAVARSADGAEMLPASALWAHARRRSDAPVDLAVVRVLRSDEGARARYATMLGALAHAASPVALAASDGTVRRRVGEHTVELQEEDGEVPMLVVRGDGSVDALEMIGGENLPETVRLDLPPPIEGARVLMLDPAIEVAALAARLIRAHDTKVFLL